MSPRTQGHLGVRLPHLARTLVRRPVVATVLGFGFIALSALFARERTTKTAKNLFLFSIIYLPLLWAALVIDRLWM